MSRPTASLAGVTRTVYDGAEKLRRTLATEWRSAHDDTLDRAHGATREDRPFPGCHPCEPADAATGRGPSTDPAAPPLR